MTKTERLGDLQLAILRVLWSEGEATVTDVHAALVDQRGLAPTTVATMLKKMEPRGLVTHRSEGRKFIYRPAVSEEQVTRSMVDDLTERLFDGDAAALVGHLISRREIEPDELAEIRKLVEKARKNRKENA